MFVDNDRLQPMSYSLAKCLTVRNIYLKANIKLTTHQDVTKIIIRSKIDLSPLFQSKQAKLIITFYLKIFKITSLINQIVQSFVAYFGNPALCF